MKSTLILLAVVLSLGVLLAAAQVNTFCASNLGCNITGAWTISGNPVASVPVNLATQTSGLLNLASQVTGTLPGANYAAVNLAAGNVNGGVTGTLPQANLPSRTVALEYVIDNAGSAITTGIKGDLEIPFACTISGVTLLADQSGSIVIDIWKQVYASYPPTVSQTITASALPTLSSATKYQDLTLTGWTKTVNAGDTLRFNVNSAATVTRVTISLRATIP